jgi:hypothetical protein
VFDFYLGIDSGVNTSLGAGDNNSAAAGIGGFGLNLLGGKLTVLALTHIGPENPSRTVPNADSYPRYLNDVVVTYKPDDTWSFTTEGNYVRDDYARAEGYGVAQYASYALSSQITLNGRAEVWRDNRNSYVAAFLMIRPELRYDRALNGSRPFNAGRDNGAFTAAADLVLGF